MEESKRKNTFIYAKSFFSSKRLSLSLSSCLSIPYKRRIGSHQIFIRKHTAKIYKVKIYSTVKSSFENIKKVYARVWNEVIRRKFYAFEGIFLLVFVNTTGDANFWTEKSFTLYHFFLVLCCLREGNKTTWITAQMFNISFLFPFAIPFFSLTHTHTHKLLH
jgi:hypothetical protein